jgi:hypothetical protein
LPRVGCTRPGHAAHAKGAAGFPKRSHLVLLVWDADFASPSCLHLLLLAVREPLPATATFLDRSDSTSFGGRRLPD